MSFFYFTFTENKHLENVRVQVLKEPFLMITKQIDKIEQE